MHGAAGWRVYAILCDVKPILSGHPIPDFDQPQGVIGVAKIEIRNHLSCLEEKSERAKQPNKQNGQRKSPAPSIVSRAVARASSSCAASLPPAWATSALPPPPPPLRAASAFAIFPA